MASGHVNRINRPNTWLHRPMLQNVKKVLANPEPSTHGTNRTCRDVRVESAIGCKADYMCSERVFRLWTRIGHGRSPSLTRTQITSGAQNCSDTNAVLGRDWGFLSAQREAKRGPLYPSEKS